MAFKRAVFPVGLIRWLPKGKLRCRLARAAAARGDARALRADPADPMVLSSFGLHRAVLACSHAGEPYLLALAATGRVKALLTAISRASTLPVPLRARIVRAVAQHDPHVALALASPDMPLDRAAIAVAAGAGNIAGQCLAGETGREAEVLRAAIAARISDWPGARRHLGQAFAADRLEPPLDPASAEPISLAALAADVVPGSVEGPLVSVVMPYRDAAATLAIAAQSILAQSWRSIELILVDDGSSDASLAIAADLSRADPRVIALANRRAPGAAGARNTGAAAAAGRFVMLHDADDWAHPRRIERQVAAASGGAAVSRYIRLDTSGCPITPQVVPFVRLGPICLLVRRKALLAAGPFDEVPSGSDSEFLARLDQRLGRARVRREGSLLMIARWSPDSISGSPVSGLAAAAGRADRERYRERWMVRHAGLDLIGDLPGLTG